MIATDNDAVHLARAAKIVRKKDMLKMKNEFSGSFDAHSQEKSEPVSLLELVSMVLNGTNITTQLSSASMPQPAITLSQLLMYNCSTHQSKAATTARHSQQRETPLAIYLATMIHTKTRKRALVDILFSLGLFLTMLSKCSYHISCYSSSMLADWMWHGMSILLKV